MKKGNLFVISGPSGTGKGTICKGVLAAMDGIELSISMTTRTPRVGEVNGRDYFFVTDEKFKEIRESNGFLENARVYDHCYGTPKQNVIDKLNQGLDVILEIDTQGALMVKDSYEESILVFILPPSLKELKKRIVERNTDSAETIEKRMKEAAREISLSSRYDYAVVNDDLPLAIDAVKSIIKAERSKVSTNMMYHIRKYEEEAI